MCLLYSGVIEWALHQCSKYHYICFCRSLSPSCRWSTVNIKGRASVIRLSLFMFLTSTGIFKSTCHIDVRWFPFDVQKCELKFGSWTYGGWSLDLKMLEADITGYIANGEWDLVGKRELWRAVILLCVNVSNESFGFVCQRSQVGWTSASTTAVRSHTLTSPSPWWCGDEPSTTASTCLSPVSWSPLWLCSSSCCQLTLEKRSHWVRSNINHTLP